MNKILIWKYIIFYIFNIHCIHNELLFVYENSRHGLRGSITGNQNSLINETLIDEYNIHWEGNGMLTFKGKMQQYILGIRNRLKYPNLIDYNKFNEEELLIHVTNTSRANESAYNHLLGMYKPFIKISKNDKLIKKILESNIFYYPPNYNIWSNESDKIFKKIITEAELNIKLLENANNNKSELSLTEGEFNLEENNKKYNMNIKYTPFSENRTFFLIFNCVNNRKYIKHNYETKFNELIKENLEDKYGNKLQSFFKYENKEWLYNVSNIIKITDHFLANYYNGRNLDEFLNKTGINKEEFYKVCLKIYKWWIYHLYCDEKTCILESQKMMEDLIEYMDNKINNKTNKLKMVINIGHDFTVCPMQIFMHEAFDVEYSICGFSCNIYIELHKEKDYNQKDIYIVKYYVDDELRLNINYEIFKRNVISKFWTEKEKDEFCNGIIIRVLYPKTFIFVSFSIIVIIILVFIFILYKCYKKYLKQKKISLIKHNNLAGKKDNDENSKELELI